MIDVSIDEYLATYKGHPDATQEVLDNASDLLYKCNKLYALAYADGCELPDNPKTGSGVSGRTDGGFRPGNSHTGAPNSTHKTGQGVDRYDPSRRFAAWCLANLDHLKECELWMEDPRWTPSWVHLQSIPPKSKKRVYIPNANAPLADYPEAWK